MTRQAMAMLRASSMPAWRQILPYKPNTRDWRSVALSM